jgi:hypothetical protein
VTKIVLPSQQVTVDTALGVDPVWYEKLQALTTRVNAMDTALAGFIAAGAYSTGTWTPVLSSIGGGTVPTFTAVALNGRYIRIGNMVAFTVYGTNTVGGTPGAGNFQMQFTLPIPAATAINPRRVQLGIAQNAGVENVLMGEIAPSATQILLYNMTGASQVAPFYCSALNNVARAVEIFGWYRC